MATESATTQQLTGCVKWFDNGKNYGFITVLTEGAHKGEDIFVHQSNIKTSRDCYRTLYTSECVVFDLAKSKSDAHPYHAENVTGFNGALLHCENPAFRGGFRGGYRNGGRGGSRGGFTRGGGRGNISRNTRSSEQETETTQKATEQVPEPVQEQPAAEQPTPAVEKPAAPVKKAGRGRGKSQ